MFSNLSKCGLTIPGRNAGLKALQEFDFSEIEWRLREEYKLEEALIATSVVEFRKFVGLGVIYGPPLGMISEFVDEVWHQLILHTKRYDLFCQCVFGARIVHVPLSPWSCVSNTLLRRFVDLYKCSFGDLPPVWNGLGGAERRRWIEDPSHLVGEPKLWSAWLADGEV